MNRMRLVLAATIAIAVGTAAVSSAQTTIPGDQGAFRFHFEEARGPRGLAIEGYVHNALPWRITNVRLRVDSLDVNGTPLASGWGWVLGDVPAGGRGYFYVPVAAPAGTYRATVQAFDRVRLETPAPEAP